MVKKGKSLKEMAEQAKKAKSKKGPELDPKDHLNAKINRSVKHEMKVFCAERNIKMQDFLQIAIQEAMARAKKKEARKPKS